MDETHNIDDNIWEYLLYFDRFEQYEENREAYLHLIADYIRKEDCFEKKGGYDWLNTSKNRCCTDVWNEYSYIKRNNFQFEALESWEDLILGRKCEYIRMNNCNFNHLGNVGFEVDVDFASTMFEHRNMRILLSTRPFTNHHPAACGSLRCYRNLESFEGDYLGCTCLFMSTCGQSSFRKSDKVSSFGGELSLHQILENIINRNYENSQTKFVKIDTENYVNKSWKSCCFYSCYGDRILREENRSERHIIETEHDISKCQKSLFEYSGECLIEDKLCNLEDLNIIHIMIIRRRHLLNFHLERARGSRDRLREVICTVFGALSKHNLPSYSVSSFVNRSHIWIADNQNSISVLNYNDNQEPIQTMMHESSLQGAHNPPILSIHSLQFVANWEREKSIGQDKDAYLTVMHEDSRMLMTHESLESVNDFESYTGVYIKGSEELSSHVGNYAYMNIKAGEFLESIQVSAKLEVKFKNGWKVCTVISRKFQGEILRFIKVRPTCSYASSSSWICLDDGRLAPLGTNLSELCPFFDISQLSNV